MAFLAHSWWRATWFLLLSFCPLVAADVKPLKLPSLLRRNFTVVVRASTSMPETLQAFHGARTCVPMLVVMDCLICAADLPGAPADVPLDLPTAPTMPAKSPLGFTALPLPVPLPAFVLVLVVVFVAAFVDVLVDAVLVGVFFAGAAF